LETFVGGAISRFLPVFVERNELTLVMC
jgi:hypothetical protein